MFPIRINRINIYDIHSKENRLLVFEQNPFRMKQIHYYRGTKPDKHILMPYKVHHV